MLQRGRGDKERRGTDLMQDCCVRGRPGVTIGQRR